MKALEWTIDKWLMQGLLTSILTGVGFLVISFAIEYIKRFKKEKQAREQEIFLQRILCGEQVLEWSNGTVRTRAKKDCTWNSGRSIPRGNLLFEHYKRAGGFLGIGQGYYSRLAEARRRLAENLQDKSMTAAVSHNSWAGGPASRSAQGASSTSVDDELTSLEWDSGASAPFLPATFVSPQSSKSEEQRSADRISSNCNNVASAIADKHARRDSASGLRLWSTQYNDGHGDDSVDPVIEKAPDLGTDLCARALREHPHLAPFLRHDALEAAQAVEVAGVRQQKRQGKATGSPAKGSRRMRDRSRSVNSRCAETRGKSLEREQKRVNLEGHSKEFETRWGGMRSVEVPVKLSSGTHAGAHVPTSKGEKADKRHHKTSHKVKAEKSSDRVGQGQEERLGKQAEMGRGFPDPSVSVGAMKEKSSITRRESRVRVTRQASDTVAKREGSDCPTRESSSVSVRSLPSSRKSDTCPLTHAIMAGGSKSQIITRTGRHRKHKTDKSTAANSAKRGTGIDPDPSPCRIEKVKSATTIAHEVRYDLIVQSQNTTHSEIQDASFSSSVDYTITSYEKKIDMSYQFAHNKPAVNMLPDAEFSGSHFEDENKDAISTSISGYIRNLMFGDSAQENSNKSPSPEIDKTYVERNNRMKPSSTMSTIEEAPFGSTSKSQDNEILTDGDNGKTISDNPFLADELCEDEKMETDSDRGERNNLAHQVSSDRSSVAEGASGSQTLKADTNIVGKTSQDNTSPGTAKKAKKKLDCQPRSMAGRSKLKPQGTQAVYKRNVKRRSPNSPPVLLTLSRSRAASFSRIPERKGSPARFSRSLSIHGNSCGPNRKPSPPKPSLKKSKKSDVPTGCNSATEKLRRTLSNVETDSKKVVSRSPIPKSRRLRLEKTKVASNLHTKPIVTESNAVKVVDDCHVLSDDGSPKGKQEAREVDGQSKGNVSRSGANKLPKTTVSRKMRKSSTNASPLPHKLRAQTLLKSASNESRSDRMQKGSNQSKDEQASSLKSTSDISNIPNPRKEKKTKHSSTTCAKSQNSKEEARNARVPMASHSARSAASTMLDNYTIEVKKKELLGSVVSLVTYHPKNPLESSHKSIVDGCTDLSGNCKHCKQSEVIINSNHDCDTSLEEKKEKAHDDVLTSQKEQLGHSETRLSLPRKYGPSSGSETYSGSHTITHATFVASTIDESKTRKTFSDERHSAFVDFDALTRKDASQTKGHHSSRLFGGGGAGNRVDTFKTIVDAGEYSPFSKPLHLRPSALDDVVKSLGSDVARKQSKDTQQPEDLNHHTVFRSQEYVERDTLIKSPISVPTDSVSLNQEMIANTTANQVKSPLVSEKKQSNARGMISTESECVMPQGEADRENSGGQLRIADTHEAPTKGSCLSQDDDSRLHQQHVTASDTRTAKTVHDPQGDSSLAFKDQVNCKDQKNCKKTLKTQNSTSQSMRFQSDQAKVSKSGGKKNSASSRRRENNSVTNFMKSEADDLGIQRGKKDIISSSVEQTERSLLPKSDKQAPHMPKGKGRMSVAKTRENLSVDSSNDGGPRSSAQFIKTKEQKSLDTAGAILEKEQGENTTQKATRGKADDLKPESGSIKIDKPSRRCNPSLVHQRTTTQSPALDKPTDNGKSSPFRRLTLCVNRSSPLMLTELDSRYIARPSENSLDVTHEISTAGKIEKNPLLLEKLRGGKSGQSTKSDIHRKNERLVLHPPQELAMAESFQNNMSEPQMLEISSEYRDKVEEKREEADRPPVIFQNVEANKNTAVKFQRLDMSFKNSLSFRPPSSGSTSSANLKKSIGSCDSGGGRKDPPSHTSLNSTRENSMHVFGSNASFSVNSFHSAGNARPNCATDPQVKVSNYRLAGDHFRTYRQRKQSDDDD